MQCCVRIHTSSVLVEILEDREGHFDGSLRKKLSFVCDTARKLHVKEVEPAMQMVVVNCFSENCTDVSLWWCRQKTVTEESRRDLQFMIGPSVRSTMQYCVTACHKDALLVADRRNVVMTQNVDRLVGFRFRSERFRVPCFCSLRSIGCLTSS